MSAHGVGLDYLKAFSNGVFAITITLLARDIKSPQSASFGAFLALWPALASYAVSYLFIAIVWVNYHHLMRYANRATSRLIWKNFAHLFTVSLIPLSTTWVANTELASVPVALYASIFVFVNATYFALCVETLAHQETKDVSPRVRTAMRVRSLITLVAFAAAALVALKYPILGMVLTCLCLVVYLRPDTPWTSA